MLCVAHFAFKHQNKDGETQMSDPFDLVIRLCADVPTVRQGINLMSEMARYFTSLSFLSLFLFSSSLTLLCLMSVI